MQVLIETRMNSLRLNESKTPKKGCLGRLEGVCADFKNPTRNGRLYPIGLWKKVFDDPLFKEALQNKTLFGELDHPEDRFEPLVKHACIVMTDYRIDEDKGLIYGGFDILDTPDGKVLKNILDYGSVLGVSSRGQGDIIEDANGERVDEDSYDFACFDVVSTPAVEKARQKVVESMNKQKKETFRESIERQIKDAESAADLNIIRSVVRASGLNSSDMESIVESIEDKCKSLKQVDGTIVTESDDGSTIQEKTDSKKSAKTIRENRKLYKCISGLKEQVSAYKHREKRYIECIEEKNDIIQTKDIQLSKLRGNISDLKDTQRYNESMYVRQNKKLESVTENLDRRLQSSNSKLNESNEKLSNVMKENKSLRSNMTSLKNENSKLQDDLTESQDAVTSLQEMLSTYEDKVRCLEEQIARNSDEHNSEITSIDEEVEEYSKLLSEAQQKITSGNSKINELQESLNDTRSNLKQEQNTRAKLEESLKKYQEFYIERVCNIQDIDPNSIYHSVNSGTTPQQIDSIVESYRKKLDRYNKLGISETGIIGDNYIVESVNSSCNKEEIEEQNNLISFLQTTAKSL